MMASGCGEGDRDHREAHQSDDDDGRDDEVDHNDGAADDDIAGGVVDDGDLDGGVEKRWAHTHSPPRGARRHRAVSFGCRRFPLC